MPAAPMKTSPHPFSLRQLQYVAAVAQTLSFRRAAELCHVSQPSLSAQLAQVEDALGVKLFERDRKRVLLTAAGRELLSRAERVLLEADDLWESARRAADPLAGTLRLGVIPTVSPYLLPRLAGPLRQKLPRLRVAWTEEKTHVLMQSLHAGMLDGAVVALESDLGEVDSAVIAKDPFVLAAPPEHVLAKKAGPASAAELRGQSFFVLDDGHCFGDQALEVCARGGAEEASFRATSLTTLVQMVRGGEGVTLLPRLAAPTELARTGLKVRPVAIPSAFRTIALVWRKSSPLFAALRTVAEVMAAAYPAAAGV